MLRKLTVNLQIEAQTADDSALAPLVVEALQEFIVMASGPEGGKAEGKFESKVGLDVTWDTKNEYFDALGQPIKTVALAVANALTPGRRAA